MAFFCRNSILTYRDDPQYRRKSSNITVLEMHLIVKKEYLIEYLAEKEFEIQVKTPNESR